MEIKTTEFFKNIKKLPPIGSKEFEDLVKWEEEKCLGGVTVNGYPISGFLYWYLNHWNIRIDLPPDENGNIPRIKSLPHLRDNEIVVCEGLETGRREQKGYLQIGGRQLGKDLLNSSKLYQEGKEITIGECNIGDQIFDDSGNLTTIVGKYPQGKKPVYKVTLLDGRELYCGLDHNWFVYDRLKKEYCKKTTRDLLPDYKRYRKSWSHRKNPFEFKYSIPTNKAVEYSEKEQLIDPYFIGLYLGDGSNYYSKITSIDKEIVDYLYSYAEKVGLQISKDGEMTYMITSGNRGGNMSDNRNFIYTYLKDNLFQNKHIPYEYLYGSIQQRMDLLAGLLDSDGYCGEKGTIEFSSTIPRLADDFEFLCRSLGINVARKNKKCSYKDKNGVKIECKDTDRFSLFTSKKVFRLARKLERQVSKPKYEDKVGICNIEYVFDDETTCIEVNNNSHLFLTDGFTITHNSEIEAAYCGMSATLYENSQNIIVAGNDADLALMRDKVDFGLKNLWEGLKIPRLDKTWKDNMVRLGFKHKDGEDDIWSYLVIRNAKDGHNTETAAGTTAKSFILDEALWQEEHVYKNNRPIRIADVEIGDLITGADGKLTKVLNKIDVGVKELWEFTLSDGRKIRSCDDHIWKVSTKNNKWMELTTKEIRTRISKTNPMYLPINEPIQGQYKDVLIPPYILGYHLGDGDSKSGRFCTQDNEVLTEYAKKYQITDCGDSLHYVAKSLVTDLKELGVYSNKHIPEEYFDMSIDQRFDLIAGLLDSDGTVNINKSKNGKQKSSIVFTNTNILLIEGFKRLVNSLGFVCSTYQRQRIRKGNLNKISYDVRVWADDKRFFKIKRKADKLIKRINSNNRIPISKIEYFEKSQAYCLKVDNEDKLFLTTDCIVTHNCGKFPFAQAFEAAKPAFNSAYGWRAVPILMGTGGAFEKGADAERFFYNPEANNLVSYLDEKSGISTGLFLSGLYRQDCKDITNLADYLTRIKGMELKETSELEKIEIRVTNEEKALAKILEEREEKKKDPDQTEYLKQIMYYPLTVEECFMTVNGNLYNAEAARARIKKINSEGITGQYVEVYHDGTKLTHKHSHKLPVSTYPAKKTENKDAPVIMWEAPMENPPFGLYVFGADPYRTDQSEWSESLGSIYIYKRVHSIAGEDFQDMFVAAYCARPKTVEEWCQNAMNLIEYYNAYGLVENDDMGFINWIIRNGKEHHLAASFDFLKSYKLESKTSRTYGIHRSNPRIVTILRNNLKTYLNEKIGEFVDEKGEKTGDILGVNRVFDTMLLEEVSKFNGILNADREVAASLAVTIANYLDPVIGVVGQTNQDPRFKAIYSRNKIPKQTFSNLRTSTFSKRKR